MPIRKVRTARGAASAVSSTATDTNPETSKTPSAEDTGSRGLQRVASVAEQQAILIDVRFSVHAVHADQPGKLVTYMVEEPDEERAKAKANELWAAGVKEVRLAMHSTHLIGRRQR